MAMAAPLTAKFRWICRAAVGFILTLAAATPSFGEIGCFEDAGQEASVSGADLIVQGPKQPGRP